MDLPRCTRARVAYADAIFDEAIEISDDASGDWTIKVAGNGQEVRVIDHEKYQRACLRVDTRMKAVVKINPAKYGDKLDLNMSGDLNLGHAAGPRRRQNWRLAMAYEFIDRAEALAHLVADFLSAKGIELEDDECRSISKEINDLLDYVDDYNCQTFQAEQAYLRRTSGDSEEKLAFFDL